MRNFKQVAAMTLAGVMTVSMAGVQTPAATNTTFSKAVSMMDVSNATGSGNVGIDIAGDEVSEKINEILYSVYREAHRNDDDTKGEDGRTAYRAAWDDHSQKLGLLESYDEKEDTYKLFKEMISNYDSQGLYILMNTELKPNASRLYKVDALSQVINDQTFIGGYESKHMKMIENVSRLSYSMYLNEEAYNALKQMYDDLYKNIRVL